MRKRAGHAAPSQSPDRAEPHGAARRQLRWPFNKSSGSGSAAAEEEPAEELLPRKKVSKCQIWLLWLFCGWTGIHHVLLDRESHAFLWLTTFNGFGFGLFRDLWRIPTYVDDYNEEPTHLDLLQATAQHGAGRWTPMRLIGMLFCAQWYGKIMQSLASDEVASVLDPLRESLPEDMKGLRQFVNLHMWMGLIGMSMGVYLIGTLGNTRGRFSAVLLAAVFGQLLRLGALSGLPLNTGDTLCAPAGQDSSDDTFECTLDEKSTYALGGLNLLCAIFAFYWTSSWDPYVTADPRPVRRRGKSCCVRFTRLMVLVGVFWGVTAVCLYTHGEVMITDKETNEPQVIKIKDAVHNFVQSPAVQHITHTTGQVYYHMVEHGWEKTLQLLKEKLDFEGEYIAYRILELDPNAKPPASPSDVKKAYHKLSMEYHPDKNPNHQDAAAERMVEINAAYQTLQKIQRRRTGGGRNK